MKDNFECKIIKIKDKFYLAMGKWDTKEEVEDVMKTGFQLIEKYDVIGNEIRERNTRNFTKPSGN